MVNQDILTLLRSSTRIYSYYEKLIGKKDMLVENAKEMLKVNIEKDNFDVTEIERLAEKIKLEIRIIKIIEKNIKFFERNIKKINKGLEDTNIKDKEKIRILRLLMKNAHHVITYFKKRKFGIENSKILDLVEKEKKALEEYDWEKFLKLFDEEKKIYDELIIDEKTVTNILKNNSQREDFSEKLNISGPMKLITTALIITIIASSVFGGSLQQQKEHPPDDFKIVQVEEQFNDFKVPDFVPNDATKMEVAAMLSNVEFDYDFTGFDVKGDTVKIPIKYKFEGKFASDSSINTSILDDISSDIKTADSVKKTTLKWSNTNYDGLEINQGNKTIKIAYNGWGSWLYEEWEGNEKTLFAEFYTFGSTVKIVKIYDTHGNGYYAVKGHNVRVLEQNAGGLYSERDDNNMGNGSEKPHVIGIPSNVDSGDFINNAQKTVNIMSDFFNANGM